MARHTVEGTDVDAPGLSEDERLLRDSDYEFWCRVPPEAAGKLAFVLLKRLYAGREQAVDELRALCAAEGVACENGSWA